ncbi:MAG: leucine-rich repeat protein [Prevotella sp.]|nr:leucine-rich repeat protein [Prevotella sp.]
MRLLTITLICLLSAMTASADPITREQARKKAETFMAGQDSRQLLVPVESAKKLAPRRKAGRAGDVTSEYYVFNKGVQQGFVIVSGDDQTEPILGYCDAGEFDYAVLPPNMKEWLDGYARQIARIQTEGAPVIRDAIPTHPKVDELMKSRWSQGYPYNLTCPEYFSLGRSVTGCVATAMAQLLYYNREKSVSETTTDMPAYDTWTAHATYGHLHVEGIPEGSPIDWENMKDEYGSATEKQRKAVADLMHYCGVAVKMDYTNASSGAQSYDAYQAFGKYFGYGSSVRYVSASSVSSDTQWDDIIYKEIAAGRPIYISGANSGGGHAFVADGYDGNLRYHINWGWGGTSNGYYLLTNLTPGQQGIGGSNDGYNDYREVIIGIEPENYGEKEMTIADLTVRRICLEHFDTDGDGKLTYGEAAAVERLGTVFKGSTIKTFTELYYFTGLTELSDDAFSGCSQLTTLRLPKNIQRIGAQALMGCARLSKLDMPNHVTAIGARAFQGCVLLKSLSLPDDMTVIEDGTFAQTGLTAVTLPTTVTAIGAEAFANCQSLSRIEVKTYRPSAISLSPSAFNGTDLSRVTLSCMQGLRTYFSSTPVWQDFGNISEQRELSGGRFAELEAQQTYYLYHVGTGQYLTKGEAYGTQAVVGDSPMRFVINHTATMADGVYYLTSPDTGREGNLLFRTSADGNVGKGVKATFVDGALSANRANAYWTILSIGDDTYTIQVPTTATGYEDGKFLGVLSSHESNAASPTYGVYSDIDYATHPLNCQWRLVRYDEQAAQTYAAVKELGNLLDIAATRYLAVDAEQAVYDRLESTYDELRQAQRSLRKKLKFVDFADDAVRTVSISKWDIDSNGELSYTEAAKVSDFDISFQNNTTLTSVDELQYFTSVNDIYGNTFSGCTNLTSVVLPPNLVHIYYYAFRNCSSLQSIALPEYVNTIGDGCFLGCTALRSVTLGTPDPSVISLGTNAFNGINLSLCTLYVPQGSKAVYEQTPVWRSFGQIVEVRGHTQPKFSAVTPDVAGYIMNTATRKYIATGEAYGTQSVVAANGLQYQFKHTSAMADGVYYLTTGSKCLFRSDTDTKVGTGVKTCFGDGSVSAKAYWKVVMNDDGTFTMQVPQTDASYVADEYLGTQDSHRSDFSSPTYGLYWDVKGAGTRWAFITADDMREAQELDTKFTQLADLLKRAGEAGVDVSREQAVYDNIHSTVADLDDARQSLRQKLHYIDFVDAKAKTLCVAFWDSNADEELSLEEAAAVTDIGTTFSNIANLKSLEDLRYFTSLTAVPDNAFRGSTVLETVYLPENVTSIGTYAFLQTSVKNLVLLNGRSLVAKGMSNLANNALVFVPVAMVDAYNADASWAERCTIVDYTGQPVVTGEASRVYGRSSTTFKMKVTGAPVDGEAAFECEAAGNSKLPVGDYPITVLPGTITTANVTYREGVLTIEPAPVTITAKSYTRQVGEPNPAFEVTFSSFRNRETDTVLTVRPVVTCEATIDSPAGEYDIVPSGADALNYAFKYVSGKLTVVANPDAIVSVEADGRLQTVYDLQGRRVATPRRGIYLRDRRKVVVR